MQHLRIPGRMVGTLLEAFGAGFWGPLQLDALLPGSLDQLLPHLSCNCYTLARLTDENSGVE